MIPLLPLPPDLPPTIGWSWARSLRVAGQAGMVLANTAAGIPTLRCDPPFEDPRFPKAADVAVAHPNGTVRMRAFGDGTGIVWQGDQMSPYPVTFARNGIVARQDYDAIVQSIAPHLPQWRGRIALHGDDLTSGAQLTTWAPLRPSFSTPAYSDATDTLRARLHALITQVLVPRYTPPAHPTPQGLTITLFAATMGQRGTLVPPRLDIQGLHDLSDEANLALLVWQDKLAAALFEEAAREGWDHHCVHQHHDQSPSERSLRTLGMIAGRLVVLTMLLDLLPPVSAHTKIAANARAAALNLPALTL